VTSQQLYNNKYFENQLNNLNYHFKHNEQSR